MEHNFAIEIAVPGFRKEELEVILEDNLLIVRGRRDWANVDQNSEFILKEFNSPIPHFRAHGLRAGRAAHHDRLGIADGKLTVTELLSEQQPKQITVDLPMYRRPSRIAGLV